MADPISKVLTEPNCPELQLILGPLLASLSLRLGLFFLAFPMISLSYFFFSCLDDVPWDGAFEEFKTGDIILKAEAEAA